MSRAAQSTRPCKGIPRSPSALVDLQRFLAFDWQLLDFDPGSLSASSSAAPTKLFLMSAAWIDADKQAARKAMSGGPLIDTSSWQLDASNAVE